MIRITTVIGARPQFIKASVMSAHFKESGIIKELIIHTGQHFDHNMSEIFFSQLNIPVPAYNLGIHGTTHGKMTGQMIMEIEEILLIEKPHYVLVYGDTNSTLAGALAAKKLNIPIIHVEAGLRSGNNAMPEEINRILTDRISSILCCPTDGAINNLKREGFQNFDCTFEKTGDIMEDILRLNEHTIGDHEQVLKKMQIAPEPYILCTMHRAENTDTPERIKSIIEAWLQTAHDSPLVIPLHPRTRSKLPFLPKHKNLNFIEPVGYLDTLRLIKGATAVMTDSGGLQKEAYMMKKYCLTLRDETEWTELTDIGVNFLVGADKVEIINKVALVKNLKWQAPDDIYGGGTARFKIHDLILTDAKARTFT